MSIEEVVVSTAEDEASGSVAYDSSPYNRPGILTNMPNVSWTTGRFGSGVQFNLSNSTILLPSLSFSELRYVTVEAWVNWGGSTSGATVFNYGVDSAELYIGSNNAAAFTIRNASSVTAAASYIITKNRWYHLVGTYNGSWVSLYIDGILTSSSPLSGPIRNLYEDEVTTGYTIGSRKVHPNYIWGGFFNGTIDEVRIYNRAIYYE